MTRDQAITEIRAAVQQHAATLMFASDRTMVEDTLDELLALGKDRWYRAEDIDKLVLQLDVAWNGLDAAKAPMLVDVVTQIVNDTTQRRVVHGAQLSKLAPLYVITDANDRQAFGTQPPMRLATPWEIGATRTHLTAGRLKVRIGDIEINAARPAGVFGATTFLVGKDAEITIDGEPYSKRTGLRMWSMTLTFAHNKPIIVEIEGTPDISARENEGENEA